MSRKTTGAYLSFYLEYILKEKDVNGLTFHKLRSFFSFPIPGAVCTDLNSEEYWSVGALLEL